MMLAHHSTISDLRNRVPCSQSPPAGDKSQDADYFFIDEFADEDAGEALMAVMPPSEKVKAMETPPRVPAFLAHLWRMPLLTEEQEQHCFRKLNYLKYLGAKTRDASAKSIEVPDETDNLRLIQDSIQRTRNFLVESNLRLVVSISKRYESPGTDRFDELVCIGNAALLRAVDRFDFRRGTRFSTYAYQAIDRSIVGVYRQDKRYRANFVSEFGNALLEFDRDAGESAMAELKASEASDCVHCLMNQLDERDRRIVMARFGINRAEDRVAFHVIARELDLSTTRTVQLFHRSIERMRCSAIEQRIA